MCLILGLARGNSPRNRSTLSSPTTAMYRRSILAIYTHLTLTSMKRSKISTLMVPSWSRIIYTSMSMLATPWPATWPGTTAPISGTGHLIVMEGPCWRLHSITMSSLWLCWHSVSRILISNWWMPQPDAFHICQRRQKSPQYWTSWQLTFRFTPSWGRFLEMTPTCVIRWVKMTSLSVIMNSVVCFCLQQYKSNVV